MFQLPSRFFLNLHSPFLLVISWEKKWSLKKCFSQYRQISGGHFLVGLKDTVCSEKNLKIKFIEWGYRYWWANSCQLFRRNGNHETENRYWFSWNFTGHTHALHPTVDKFLYLLQAILQRNIWKKNQE